MISKIPGYLLQDEITIEPFEGEGAYGKEYGNPFTAKGHFEKSFEVITDRDGREVVASATVFLDSEVSIKAEDRVGFDGENYEVIDAQAVRPFGKSHHTEVKLKSKAKEEDNDNGDNGGDPYT